MVISPPDKTLSDDAEQENKLRNIETPTIQIGRAKKSKLWKSSDFLGQLLTKCVTLCYIPAGGGGAGRWLDQSTLCGSDSETRFAIPIPTSTFNTQQIKRPTTKFEL